MSEHSPSAAKDLAIPGLNPMERRYRFESLEYKQARDAVEQVLTIGRQASRSAKIALFCLLYAAGAAIAFPDTFLRILAAYPLRGLLLVIAVLLGTGLFAAAFWNRPRSPLTFIRDKIADRGMGFSIIVVVFFLAATATTTIKHEFGHLASFYADPAIADIDELLHFGTAPWQWARMALPADRKSTRLNSSHVSESRMPSSA